MSSKGKIKVRAISLPGLFADLIPDKSISSEALGRLVRCAALETDAYATPDQKDLVAQILKVVHVMNQGRTRMQRFRSKNGAESPCPTAFVPPAPEPDHPRIVEKTPPAHPDASVARPKEILSPAPAPAPSPVLDLFGNKEAPEQLLPRAKPAFKLITSPQTIAHFTTFWTAYPRKIGKKDALKAFVKKLAAHAPDQQEAFVKTLLEAIDRQKLSDQWTEENGQYIPHPATWLNGERWTDDLGPCTKGPVKNPKSSILVVSPDEERKMLERLGD